MQPCIGKLGDKYNWTRDFTASIPAMLDQCWASVVDGGLTLVQHWVNVSCLLGCRMLKGVLTQIQQLHNYKERVHQKEHPGWDALNPVYLGLVGAVQIRMPLTSFLCRLSARL